MSAMPNKSCQQIEMLPTWLPKEKSTAAVFLLPSSIHESLHMFFIPDLCLGIQSTARNKSDMEKVESSFFPLKNRKEKHLWARAHLLRRAKALCTFPSALTVSLPVCGLDVGIRRGTFVDVRLTIVDVMWVLFGFVFWGGWVGWGGLFELFLHFCTSLFILYVYFLL